MSQALEGTRNDPISYGQGSPVRQCPRCQGPAYRVQRRVIDRLVSLIFPRHRYRCESWDCRWEGNFRVKRRA
jgi:hypothetical protein